MYYKAWFKGLREPIKQLQDEVTKLCGEVTEMRGILKFIWKPIQFMEERMRKRKPSF